MSAPCRGIRAAVLGAALLLPGVAAAQAPSGSVVFKVENADAQVTEFYLLGEDGLRIVGEVENIGPGITRDLVVQAAPGRYYTACKPGMVGDGIRAPFTVTDSGADLTPNGPLADQLTATTTAHAAYVRDQTEQLRETWPAPKA